jgi:hypothetical protein
MRGSKAKRLVRTLDACHTGVEMGRDLSDPAFIQNAFELAEGFALIAASTAQQVAQEWQEAKHGVFTYYLLEGLTGKADYASKGFVSVQDLQTYVVNNLRQWNVRHGGRIQEPTFRADGIGDMIVGDYRQYAKPDSVVPTVSTISSATVSRRTPEERSPSTMPSPHEMKRQALQQQYQDLQAEYQEVYTEISFSSGAARLKLERQAESLLRQMTTIDDQLKQL